MLHFQAAPFEIAAIRRMYLETTQLKKGKIRGEISEGMLLSERELNLSDDHEGIIELSYLQTNRIHK